MVDQTLAIGSSFSGQIIGVIPQNLTFKSQVFWRNLKHRNETATGFELGPLGQYGFLNGLDDSGLKDKIYMNLAWRYSNQSAVTQGQSSVKQLLAETKRLPTA